MKGSVLCYARFTSHKAVGWLLRIIVLTIGIIFENYYTSIEEGGDRRSTIYTQDGKRVWQVNLSRFCICFRAFFKEVCITKKPVKFWFQRGVNQLLEFIFRDVMAKSVLSNQPVVVPILRAKTRKKRNVCYQKISLCMLFYKYIITRGLLYLMLYIYAIIQFSGEILKTKMIWYGLEFGNQLYFHMTNCGNGKCCNFSRFTCANMGKFCANIHISQNYKRN